MRERSRHICIPIAMAAASVMTGTALAQLPPEVLDHRHLVRVDRLLAYGA